MSSSVSELRARPGLSRAIVGVGLVAAMLFLLPASAGTPWLRLVAKPVPVLCMALWLGLRPGKGPYQVAVIAGLVLGATGDVLLELGDRTFILGLAAFLLGHLAYVGAFLQDCRRPRPLLALASYAYGILAFVILNTAGDLGALTLPVAAYVLVISTMLWRGLSRWGVAGIARGSARLGAAGAVLFTASDSVLAYSMFVERFGWAGLLIMSTYWLGQLGITLSADQAGRLDAG